MEKPDNYTEQMDQLQAECLYWIEMANMEYATNGHTKQQCIYLQKAIDARDKMARISRGSEREFQARRKNELGRELNEVIMAVDPDYFRRKQLRDGKSDVPGAPIRAGSGTGGKPRGVSAADRSVPQEEVDSWHKEIPERSFEDVNGMEELKKKLRSCISDSRLDAIRAYMELSKQRAYLFSGPPGCGKTYIIGAFVHELVGGDDYEYLSVESSDILARYVGEGEARVKRLFEEAEKKPTVLFIDEIDGVCRDRGRVSQDYTASLTTAFLTGFNHIKESDSQVIFVGATNYINRVDKAMRDRCEVIEVPYPDRQARACKFARELKMFQQDHAFSFLDMAEMTGKQPYNYRDIERLCLEIKLMAIDELIQVYRTESAALNAVKSGEFRIGRALFEKAQKRSRLDEKDDGFRVGEYGDE